jgi:histidyl-tRNA synthetase
MTQANQLRARYLLVLGENEADAGRGKLKDMDSGDEREVPLDPESLAELLYPECDGGCEGGCSS